MKQWLAGVCWRWWLRLEDAGGIERMIRVWHYDIENRDGENTLWAVKRPHAGMAAAMPRRM